MLFVKAFAVVTQNLNHPVVGDIHRGTFRHPSDLAPESRQAGDPVVDVRQMGAGDRVGALA